MKSHLTAAAAPEEVSDGRRGLVGTVSSSALLHRRCSSKAGKRERAKLDPARDLQASAQKRAARASFVEENESRYQ